MLTREYVIAVWVVRKGACGAEGLAFGCKWETEDSLDCNGEGGRRDRVDTEAWGVGEGETNP